MTERPVPDLSEFVKAGRVAELPPVRAYRKLAREAPGNRFRVERGGISMDLKRNMTLVCEARGGRELRWVLDEDNVRALIAHLIASIDPAFTTEDEAVQYAHARGFTDGAEGRGPNWSSPSSYSTAYYGAYMEHYAIGAKAWRAAHPQKAAPLIGEDGLPHHVEAGPDGHRCLDDCPACSDV